MLHVRLATATVLCAGTLLAAQDPPQPGTPAQPAAAAALAKAADAGTRVHIENSRDQIARILDPKFAPPAMNSPALVFRAGIEDSCWPDYIVQP
jgi:hypothetical protein